MTTNTDPKGETGAFDARAEAHRLLAEAFFRCLHPEHNKDCDQSTAFIRRIHDEAFDAGEARGLATGRAEGAADVRTLREALADELRIQRDDARAERDRLTAELADVKPTIAFLESEMHAAESRCQKLRAFVVALVHGNPRAHIVAEARAFIATPVVGVAPHSHDASGAVCVGPCPDVVIGAAPEPTRHLPFPSDADVLCSRGVRKCSEGCPQWQEDMPSMQPKFGGFLADEADRFKAPADVRLCKYCSWWPIARAGERCRKCNRKFTPGFSKLPKVPVDPAPVPVQVSPEPTPAEPPMDLMQALRDGLPCVTCGAVNEFVDEGGLAKRHRADCPHYSAPAAAVSEPGRCPECHAPGGGNPLTCTSCQRRRRGAPTPEAEAGVPAREGGDLPTRARWVSRARAQAFREVADFMRNRRPEDTFEGAAAFFCRLAEKADEYATSLPAAPAALPMVEPREPETAPPEWVRDGAPVWYRPNIYLGAPSFEGVVNGSPRLVGSTWCVALRDMERLYRNGERDHVPAAAISHLEPRVTPETSKGGE